jgi:hypothetical protein
MSTDYDLPEDVDFVLVRRDGELLDAIARRDRGYADLGELADDPALTLLAAFASDVDEGLVELLAELDAVADADPVGADEVQPDAVRPVPEQRSRPIRKVVPTSHRLPSGAVRIPGHAATRPSSAAPRRTEAPAAARRAHHVGRAGAAAAVVAAVLSVGGVAAAVTGNPLSPVESVAHTVANVFGHGPSSHASDRAKLEASLHDVDALI